MWSDFVRHAEQLHYLRLFIWGALSTLAGTSVLVVAHRRSRGTALIRRFAAISAIGGTIVLLAALIAYRGVPTRDLSGATRLDRLSWLQLGLYIGLSGVGITVALGSLVLKSSSDRSDDRALSLIGAGVAIALQGLALTTLELALIASISR